jgi:predicted transcriptional regulator
MAAAEVHHELGGGLAYNTVQTVLFRLHDKRSVERHRVGRVHVYWPTRDAAAAAAFQMTEALAERTDRHAVLQLFAESLDRSDAELLRQLLAESGRRR